MRSARFHAVRDEELASPNSFTPKRRRRFDRRVVAGVGAAAAAVAVTAVVGLSGRPAVPAADNVGNGGGDGGGHGRSNGGLAGLSVLRSLPWPEDGQASVSVEGLGSLGSRGGRQPVPIASVAKVMTAYVVLRDHPLREGESGPFITVDRTAAQESGSRDESNAYVWEGQKLTERQLLELMLIPSGNNIARLLARWDAGTQGAFAAKMNRTADSLGMADTTYTGASGIEATTVSTAADQLKLARQVMRNPVLRAIVAEPSATIPGTGTIRNTNGLLGSAGVIGLKTGSSTPAGGALMWAAETTAGGRTWLILGVVLYQRANTTPEEGPEAALDNSQQLIGAVEKSLPSALAAHHA